jgi:hypothetical protein
MIVKMQRPISTNQPVPTALVYNQDRSIRFQVAFTTVADLFDSTELKVYVEVTVTAGVMKVVQKVPPQAW